MTELPTRGFISQWPYDHGHDVRDETVVQWRSVDRVAEHARQRESHLEDNFGDLDFEKRAAALEVYFLGAPRCGSLSSDRKSPPTTKTVPRVRPQSASSTRRVNANNDASSSVNEKRGRQRPQSAKYRSEVPRGDQNIDRVDWNVPAQSKNSKWREMLARGPEFEQLSLRKLELETYELLSRTFEQRYEVDVQSSARRRRKGMKECSADSKELARGSGLHLARSRKKRQQEHDREMMLGKGRQSSHRSERDRHKDACEDKTAIQDKTRRRGKLLKKKTIQKPLQETQPARHLSKQDKQPRESYLQRPTSAHRAKGPWVPSGLSSSGGIRYTSSGNSEGLMTQDKRIAQMLEAFQSHANTHLRISKNIQKQLKKAQHSAKTARCSESRKTEQIIKASPDLAKRERPSSASVSTLQGAGMSISRGNQEDDRDQSPVLRELALCVPVLQKQHPPFSALFSESPATPKLVIPPLKFPPNLWEYQQSHDTQDGLSERSQCRSRDQPSVGQEGTNPVTPSTAALVDEFRDTKTFSTKMSEGLQEDRVGNQTATPDFELGKRATIEEGYLAESLAEQASTELSTGDSESSPSVPQEDFQEEASLRPDLEEDVNDELLVSRKVEASDLNDANMDSGDEGTRSASLSNEVFIFAEISRSLIEVVGSPLPGTNTTRFQLTEENDLADTSEVSDWSSHEVGKPVMKAENDFTSNSELQLSVEHNTGENQSSTVDNQTAVDISGGTVESQPSSGDLVILVGYSNDGERGRRPRELDEPAIVHEVDPKSVSLPMTDMEGEQDYTHAVVPESLKVVVTNGEDDTVFTLSRYDQLPEISEDVRAKQDLGSDTVTNENQDSIILAGNSDVSLPENRESSIQNQSPDLDIGGPNQLLGDFGAMMEINDVGQVPPTETKSTVDYGDSAPDVFQLEDSNHANSNNSDECPQVESGNAESSNVLLLDYSTMTMQPVEDTAQSGTSSGTEANDKQPAPETKLDLVPTKASSPARSPKKKTKKTKTAASDKSPTPKKKKPAVAQSTASVVDIVITASLPEQNCYPDVHSSNSDPAEEDSLRLHQQEVTRSFLKRISSRKLVEPESSSSIHVESQIEQVECGNALGSTESETATAVMDETPFEQNAKPVKESENIDGDSVSLLKRESSQVLNNCESTVEKYPPATESTATTSDPVTTPPTEKVDMAAAFASVENGSSLASMVVSIFDANPEETEDPLDAVAQAPCHEEPNNSNNTEDVPLQEQSQPASTTPDNLTSRSDAKEIIDESPTQPSADHHNVASKIQAQYRCFVRRRIILDQLRFILAKQRRKARKSRHKVKKAKAVDKDTSEEIAVVHVSADANSMDNLPEEIQQVALTSMSSEIGVEMASTAQAPESSEPTVKLGARKGSCDYAFDLFDDPEEANGEVMQEAATVVSAVEDKLSMGVVLDADTYEPSSEKLDDQQEDLAALPEKDVMVASTNATTSFEPLQVEEGVLYEKPVVLPNKAIEVEAGNNSAAPAGTSGLLTSMMLADLAFSEDVEEEPAKPVDTVLVEAASEGMPHAQPHWERYVDGTTNKSFHYNPSTNETQWTAPAEDRDNAAINSSRVTPTTPRRAAATATDAVVSPNGQSLSAQETTGTWQEFLDEATGHLYYYNTKTGECSWEPPAPSGDSPGVVESLQSVATAESAAFGVSPWIIYIDPASQAPYYVNMETLATSWEQPEEFTVAAQPNADMYVIGVDDHSALQI